MPQKKNRFRNFERYITICLTIATILFFLFLSAAGSGNIGMKIFLAIIAVADCCYCLWLLYKNRELVRRRSLWMSVWSICLVVCIFASIILDFPSPNLYG